MRGDRAVERKTYDRRGQERDHELEQERTSGGARADHTDRQAAEASAIEPEHGEERARLDDDLEIVHDAPHEPHRMGGEDEVARRGNREKLRESLHRTQYGGLKERHGVSGIRVIGAVDAAQGVGDLSEGRPRFHRIDHPRREVHLTPRQLFQPPERVADKRVVA